MILIKDGRILDPQNGTEQIGNIEIEGTKIKRIGNFKPADCYDEEIDGKDFVVAPGLVDVHVHFRDPGFTYKEDIQSGARAAAKGGFTTVICMANTKPAVDNADTLKYIIEEGKKTGIHVLAAAAISVGLQGKELVDMKALLAAGAVGFTDDGIPLLDETLVVKAMEEAKKLQVPLSFHEEDPALIFNNGINRGAVSEALGIGGSPREAEDRLVERDCRLALETGALINIQHISSKNSVEYVRRAKTAGAHVVAEATPHHFTLTEDAILQAGALAKMNPPLRTKEDRAAIIEGLRDGTIDVIATDHAPHSIEEKKKNLTEAPSGIIGLETSLALGITHLVRAGHLDLAQLIKKMSANPAMLYGLEPKGIVEGAEADLVIFDEKELWEVRDFLSKSCNSPFIGEKLYGKVKYTLCQGKVVYREESENGH